MNAGAVHDQAKHPAFKSKTVHTNDLQGFLRNELMPDYEWAEYVHIYAN